MKKILIDDTVVPSLYVNFVPDKERGYEVCVYVKADAREGEIAQVGINRGGDFERLGMIIPVLALISKDHGYEEKRFFVSYAHALFNLIQGREFSENTYFYIACKDQYSAFGLSFSANEHTHVFYNYGVYPLGLSVGSNSHLNDLVLYDEGSYREFDDEIVLSEFFDLTKMGGFFKKLLFDHCRMERSYYARFLYFYQVVEMAMELVFHAKLDEMRRKKTRIGTIRSKMRDLNSESDLINLLYCEMGRGGEKAEDDIIKAAESILEEKDQAVSCILYGFRNVLVHNYHRKDEGDNLKVICHFMEVEGFRILSWLSRNKPYSDMMGSDYI